MIDITLVPRGTRVAKISALISKMKGNNILKSSAGLLLITLLVKVFGYAEKLVLAYYYGTGYQVDAYAVTLSIVLAVFYFFREIVEPGYLNTFLHTMNVENEKPAWILFNKSLHMIFFITVTITIVAVLFPGTVINIFAPGFHDEKFDLSVKLIQIATPGCIFLALSTLTSITLNGLKIFILPASGELAFKALIIICLVFFYKSYGIVGAAIGIILGSVGRLTVQLAKLYKKISFRRANIQKEDQKRLWVLTWPLLIGVTFSQISSLIDNVFASYLQEGAIAALSYSKKIIELPVIIFPYILSIVIFPYFSQLAIEKDQKKLNKLFSGSIRWIMIIFLPLSIFFLVFSKPIIEILLQRGAFDANSTLLTAKPLGIYSIGMVFFAIETILVIFYYANSDTKTPVFVGIACTSINILLTFILVQFIGYLGIALAFVIHKIAKNTVLLKLIKHKIEIDLKAVRQFLISILLATIAFSTITLIAKVGWFDKLRTSSFLRMTSLTAIFMAGGLSYALVLNLTKTFIPRKN